MRLLVLVGLLFIVGVDGLWGFGRRRAKRHLALKGTLPYTLSDRMLTDNLFLKNVANYSH